MSQEKYIGMDVHQATVSAAVRDRNGNLLMECVLETARAWFNDCPWLQSTFTTFDGVDAFAVAAAHTRANRKRFPR